MRNLEPIKYTDKEFIKAFKAFGSGPEAFTYWQLSEKNLPRSSPLWEFAAACSLFAKSFQGSLDALHNKASELGLHEETDD